MCKPIIFSFIAALALLAPLRFVAADEIGSVRAVHLGAYGTMPGEDRERLYARDDVFVDELIQTTKKARAQIRFLDDTDLHLGPLSEVRLDEFIYDPDQSTGAFVADLGIGVFRFVTGEIPSDAIQVITPVAVIGVRGTDFLVKVIERTENDTVVACIRIEVYDGTLTARPREGGEEISLESGQVGAGCDPGASVAVTTTAGLSPPDIVSGEGPSGEVGGGGGH